MPKKFSAYKGTARCCLATTKSRAGKIFSENFEKPPLRLPEPGLFPVQYYNRPVRKKSPPNGLERS